MTYVAIMNGALLALYLAIAILLIYSLASLRGKRTQKLYMCNAHSVGFKTKEELETHMKTHTTVETGAPSTSM
jgi:hypothetical protein